MTEHPGLLNWYQFGEKGVSSETIATYLTTGRTPRLALEPSDPADFRRCEKLLRAVQTLRPHLHKMGELSASWKRLVEHWDELVELLETEVPRVFEGQGRGMAPKTYERISELRGAR